MPRRGRAINYILGDDHIAVPEPDFLKWGLWIETAERHVAIDDIGKYKVSTIFLGLDQSFSDDGPPLLFETMVFEYSKNHKGLGRDWIAADDFDMFRYATWDEAQAGHNRLAALVRREVEQVADLSALLGGVKGL